MLFKVLLLSSTLSLALTINVESIVDQFVQESYGKVVNVSSFDIFELPIEHQSTILGHRAKVNIRMTSFNTDIQRQGLGLPSLRRTSPVSVFFNRTNTSFYARDLGGFTANYTATNVMQLKNLTVTIRIANSPSLYNYNVSAKIEAAKLTIDLREDRSELRLFPIVHSAMVFVEDVSMGSNPLIEVTGPSSMRRVAVEHMPEFIQRVIVRQVMNPLVSNHMSPLSSDLYQLYQSIKKQVIN